MIDRYEVTENAKAKALGNVFYEIQQLWASSHLVGQPALLMNAFLESMLVHVRVLLEFFERNTRSTRRSGAGRQENDDVLSADFGFAARPIDLNPQYRRRLNKDLAHLSYSRNERRLPDEKRWPRQEVVQPLIERCIEFIDFLVDDELRESPDAALADWRQLRDNLVKMRAGFAGIITDI